MLAYSRWVSDAGIRGIPFAECRSYQNKTFLVLIPKKKGARDIQDFRPINLVGSLYKILAKVLANKLKRVIDKVVSNNQNAFEGGLDRFWMQP